MKELPLPRDCQINPMIDGTKQMNILEMRLFWLALDDVRTQLATRGGSCQDGFDALRILPGQVKRIFANGSYLERLASACDLLRSWSIDWQDEDEDDVIYKVFRTIGYQPKDGLTIKFNPSMQPFLLDLYYERPGFEKCSLAQLFQLSSAHAVHLLAWLLQYRRTRRRETLTRYIDVNDLRCLLYIKHLSIRSWQSSSGEFSMRQSARSTSGRSTGSAMRRRRWDARSLGSPLRWTAVTWMQVRN